MSMPNSAPTASGSITALLERLKQGDHDAVALALAALLPAPGRPGARNCNPRPRRRRRRGGRGPQRLRQLLPPGRTGTIPRPEGPRRPVGAAGHPHGPQGGRPGPTPHTRQARAAATCAATRPCSRPATAARLASTVWRATNRRRRRPPCWPRKWRACWAGCANPGLRQVAVWKLEGYSNAEIAARAGLLETDRGTPFGHHSAAAEAQDDGLQPCLSITSSGERGAPCAEPAMSVVLTAGDLSEEAVWRLEEACCRFEQAWQSGQQPRLEDFLAGAEGAERLAVLRELLRLDVHYRRRAGEAPSAAGLRHALPRCHRPAERDVPRLLRGLRVAAGAGPRRYEPRRRAHGPATSGP